MTTENKYPGSTSFEYTSEMTICFKKDLPISINIVIYIWNLFKKLYTRLAFDKNSEH